MEEKKDKRIGNQFWKLRSKHGRDKLFNDPNLLWESACEYFQWIDDHPWIRHEQVKYPVKPVKTEDGEYYTPTKIADIPTERPYTFSGLCLYLDCDEHTLRSYGRDEDKKDFFPIVRAIIKAIETQQLEGASVGAFNANIIARKLGLVDRQAVEQKNIIVTIQDDKTGE